MWYNGSNSNDIIVIFNMRYILKGHICIMIRLMKMGMNIEGNKHKRKFV